MLSVLSPPAHHGGRRLCRRQLSELTGERGRCLLPRGTAPTDMHRCQGSQEGGRLGVPPQATPPQCWQHVGSLRAPGTARLLIGTDRAEEREKGEGRHREGRDGSAGPSLWVPQASPDRPGTAEGGRGGPLTKGYLGPVPPQGCDSGGVAKRRLAGRRNKMKPLPEQEEGARRQIFKGISFP